MTHIIRKTQTLALSILFAAGTAGFAIAQTSNSQNANTPGNYQATNSQNGYNTSYGSNYSASMVRNAQQQLKNDGYYTGNIDGIDGPMTRQAIKKYQQSQNLTVNGRLDKKTCEKLGLQRS